MPIPTSLLNFAPETAVHGVDIRLQVKDNASGTFYDIGGIYDITWTEDQGLVETPVLGDRRQGSRHGRFKVTGTFTGYYINAALRAMNQGYMTSTTTGVSSAVYHSQAPFNRYQIQIVSNNSSIQGGTFYNVTLGKDVIKGAQDKLIDETIDFVAEDFFGQ